MMKAIIRLCELLNVSNCIEDLGRKYSNYLSYSLISVLIYAIIIIRVMGNKNGA